VSIGRGGGAMSAEPSTGAEATSAGTQSTPNGAHPAPTDGLPAPNGARAAPTDALPAPNGGVVLVRITGAFGAVLGYGCLAAFLYLISLQIYRWFREGDWTHFGVADGMSVWLARCCVKDGDTGRLAALVRWLDAPADWMGLHKVLEILPASLALFALSILGNSIFIYCRDWSDARRRADSVRGS
jgi:hypothetical protein